MNKRKLFLAIWLAISAALFIKIQLVLAGGGVPQIISPNGGETWNIAETHKITWNHPSETLGKTIQLSIHLLGPDSYLIGSSAAPGKDLLLYGPTNVLINSFSGEFLWTIPNSLADGSYKIEVEEYDPSAGLNHIDLSDAPFGIKESLVNGIVSGGCVAFSVDNAVSVSEAKINLNGKSYTIPASAISISKDSTSIYAFVPPDGTSPKFQPSIGTTGAYYQQYGFIIADIRYQDNKIYIINNLSSKRLDSAGTCPNYTSVKTAAQVNVSGDPSFVGATFSPGQSNVVVGRFKISATGGDVIINKFVISADTRKGNFKQLDIYDITSGAENHIFGFGGNESDNTSPSVYESGVFNNGILFIPAGTTKVIQLKTNISSSATPSGFKFAITSFGFSNTITPIISGLTAYSGSVAIQDSLTGFLDTNFSQIGYTTNYAINTDDGVKILFIAANASINDSNDVQLTYKDLKSGMNVRVFGSKNSYYSNTWDINSIRVLSPVPVIFPYPNGAIVKTSSSDKIYLIESNKKRWITNTEAFLAYGLKPNSEIIISQTDLDKYPFGPDITAATPNLSEGALIRAKGDIDVWIVKYVGAKKFKRLILSPSAFNSYGHLRWSNIKDIDRSTVDSFTTSDLVRAVNDFKVYKLYPSGDTGQKRLVATADTFNRLGFDWDSIYQINQIDRNLYNAGQIIE
ncbi:MAG: hypothetical protein A3A94_01540 [Candidatus Portnoybacteria bacterium RIFCSPLOWO2_01_FULL_43_11]|uniref:Uncharacterized protein n=4 Tax=Candidatus Portnoyibacteriota TaxID=1817913 RepID=A0A1G2FE31_9BACT|nr:MAG: hypothetical protein A2815_00285 [Candidatus Portnoybacteria bacterium RIFCSPHIGHO2_01_FULL_40_12b]OGZ39150.1 MAG: hypothetical protein A3A94_01540 [Candidatus Portnoybacteria bacterium RIFCSPLOWO2_01_FULL_43_11]OGZ39418.1 MAG: hypothetical protein A3E90_03480 [Candidatus Portnoybacteria bacterium RIFCSPHIGHO2_12_FULL_40_11]OGZ39880.1 MAG: hypothetical protein A3I20_02695 [Candidatus Portnoybacteria bacterium RIFCSPLOWO2_02_FULL_40_15]